MKLPEMTERPEKRVLITAGAYWLMMLFLIPIVLIYFTIGFHENDKVLGWVQIIYHVINLVCVIFIFKDHLYDCWLTVQLQTKKVILTALVGVIASVFLLKIGKLLGPLFLPMFGMAANGVPMVELELFLFPKYLVEVHSLLGTLVVVSASVTVACLLYGLGFSAACSHRSWLGYVVVTGVLILHRCFFYYTVGTVDVAASAFWVQLPVHLLACAAYHYTDSIWTPIFMLAVLNLLGCVGVV